MPLVTHIVFHLSSLDLQIWIGPLPKVLNKYGEEGVWWDGGRDEDNLHLAGFASMTLSNMGIRFGI